MQIARMFRFRFRFIAHAYWAKYSAKTTSCSSMYAHRKNREMDSGDKNCTAIKRGNGRLAGSSNDEQATATYPRRNSSGCNGCRGYGGGRTGGAAPVRMFRVLLDPPSAGAFFSGSEVRGRVQVDTEQEQKFKYIHISLTGRAQVRN